MRKFVVTTVAVGAATAAALGLDATATADQTPDVVVKNLQSEGYNVQLNGANNAVPLSRCTVTGIHPSNLDPSASRESKQSTLVTVDVQCPHS